MSNINSILKRIDELKVLIDKRRPLKPEEVAEFNLLIADCVLESEKDYIRMLRI